MDIKKDEVHKIISEDRLKDIFFRSDKNHRVYYIAALYKMISKLYLISGIQKIIDRFIREFDAGHIDLNRSFVHILLAHSFNNQNFLKDIESQNPAFDLVLSNDLKIELTRYADFEKLMQERIEDTLDRNFKYTDYEIIFRLKTDNIASVQKELIKDIKNLGVVSHIENDIYEIDISQRTQGFSVPIMLGGSGMMAMSSREHYNIAIHFKENSANINNLLIDKNKKEAYKNSDILIIDLTNSLKIDNIRIDRQNGIDSFLRSLDIKEIPKNIKMIMAVYCYWDNNNIDSVWKYVILDNSDKIIEFEKEFLNKVLK